MGLEGVSFVISIAVMHKLKEQIEASNQIMEPFLTLVLLNCLSLFIYLKLEFAVAIFSFK